MPEITLESALAAIQPPLSWWGLGLAALLIIIRVDVVAALLQGRVLGVLRLAIQISAVLVLAGALGPVWWHFWMYQGWSGPPSWMSALLAAVTDSTEWTVHKEMVVSLCMLFTMLVLTTNLSIAMRLQGVRTKR